VYWVVLRLVLLVVFFSMTIAAVSVAASGQGLGASLSIFWHFPVAALQVFAWVTLVFVAFEIIEAKFDFFGKWDPRTLPKLSNKKRPSTTQTITSMVFSAIFGVWWLVGLKHQFWIFGPGVFFIRFGPVWQTIYPLFVVLVLYSIFRSAVEIARPGWERGRTWLRLIYQALNLSVLYFLFKATDMFVPGPSSPAGMNEVIKSLNSGMHIGVLIFAIIAVAEMGWDVYTLIRDRFKGTEHATACLFL